MLIKQTRMNFKEHMQHLSERTNPITNKKLVGIVEYNSGMQTEEQARNSGNYILPSVY